MTAKRAHLDQASRPADDDPLRLEAAAALAFPDGSMTAKGLRRENGRGRLVIERVAGKDYTTLAHIKRMRELCRLEAKARDSGSAKPAATSAEASAIPPSGSSATDDIRKAHDAALMIVTALKDGSRPTSRGSTLPPRHKANVIRPRFR